MNTNLTTDDINAALQRALETIEGANMYTPGPWPITLKLLSDPMTVIYVAGDSETYERPFTIEEMEDGSPNAILGQRRQVEARTVWLPVVEAQAAFAFDGGPFGTRKTWSGLIFRAGNYPDKGVNVTSEDLKAIVAGFPSEGVPVMSEHTDSLIGTAMQKDGACLKRVWTANGGTELHGEIETPGWLDYALREVTKSVSVGLDATKQFLHEISLVLNPRVADAAVFAAALTFTASPEFIDFRRDRPEAAAAITNLAHKATKQAPASRAGQGDPQMTFRNKIGVLWSSLTPEQRVASGLTDAEMNDATNFAAEKETELPEPFRTQFNDMARRQNETELAGVRQAATVVFNQLLQSERKVTPAMRADFETTYIGLMRGKDGFVFASGIPQETDAAKAFRNLFKELKPLFRDGEQLPVEFKDKTETPTEAEASYTAAGKQAAGVGGKN